MNTKKFLVSVLVVSLVLAACALPVMAEGETDASGSTAASSSESASSSTITDITVLPSGEVISSSSGSTGDTASNDRVTIGGIDFGGLSASFNFNDTDDGVNFYEIIDSVPDVLPKGLEASLESIFGTYTPRYEKCIYYLSDGTSYTVDRQVEGLAGLDWEWLATVGLYALCLYSFFRLVGCAFERC